MTAPVRRRDRGQTGDRQDSDTDRPHCSHSISEEGQEADRRDRQAALFTQHHSVRRDRRQTGETDRLHCSHSISEEGQEADRRDS